MTPPGLVLVSPVHCDLPRVMQTLRDSLVARRPDLLIAHATPEVSAMTATAGDLVSRGASEVVCVPLRAAGLHFDADLARELSETAARELQTLVSLSDPLGATGPLFSAVDRRLQQALTRQGVRELDSLVLWHDARRGDHLQLLERRTRAWAARHRLPARLACLADPSEIDDAVASHRTAGHRHIGVATMALDVQPSELARAARLPRVVAVSQPLGGHEAVAEAILATYAVAAVQALELPIAC